MADTQAPSEMTIKIVEACVVEGSVEAAGAVKTVPAPVGNLLINIKRAVLWDADAIAADKAATDKAAADAAAADKAAKAAAKTAPPAP